MGKKNTKELQDYIAANKDDKEVQKYLKDQQEKEILKYCKATGHRVPVTRREFMASGVATGASWILAPSLAQMLAMGQANAQAVECAGSGGGGGNDLSAFFTVSLRGGAALNAHVLPMQQDGDFLPSYSSVGRGNPATDPSFRTLNLFGNVWFETSTFLDGIIQGVSQGADSLASIRATVPTTETTVNPDLDLANDSTTGDNPNDGIVDNDTDTVTTNRDPADIADDQSTAIEDYVRNHPVLGKVGILSICNRSQSDSNTNKFDISSWMQNTAYVDGRTIPMMGNRDTATGIGHNFAGMRPDAPLIVNSLQSIATAMGAATGVMANLSDDQRIKLFQLVNNLTGQQAAKLNRMPAAEKLGALAQCATGKNIETASAPDPSGQLLNGTANIWQNNTNEENRIANNNQNFGNMTMAVLKGYSGAAGLEMGGYDYHGNQRADTDERDRSAGLLVGKILASAAVEAPNNGNKKAFIQVVSDGSCVSGISDAAEGVGWATDSSERAMTLMFAYDPASASGPVISENQLGQYTQPRNDRQVADTSTLVGGNVEIASAAVFANLMSFNGQSASQVAEALGGFLTAAQIATLIKIAG